MTSRTIADSIQKKRLQLELEFKLFYYRFPILFSFIAVICFINGSHQLSLNFDLLNGLDKIGLFFFVLALSLALFLWNNLKMKSLAYNLPKENLKMQLIYLADINGWKLKTETKNSLIFEVDRYGYSRDFLAMSNGEKIYLFLDQNTLYYKSIFDVKKNAFFTISSGENRKHEKSIEKSIVDL